MLLQLTFEVTRYHATAAEEVGRHGKDGVVADGGLRVVWPRLPLVSHECPGEGGNDGQQPAPITPRPEFRRLDSPRWIRLADNLEQGDWEISRVKI